MEEGMVGDFLRGFLPVVVAATAAVAVGGWIQKNRIQIKTRVGDWVASHLGW